VNPKIEQSLAIIENLIKELQKTLQGGGSGGGSSGGQSSTIQALCDKLNKLGTGSSGSQAMH
jgi:hypothetical protein